MSEFTVSQLRSLRTEDAKAQREALVHQYFLAIRDHVLYVARYGSVEEARFWVVSPIAERVALKHVSGLFYPWTSKCLLTTGNPLYDAKLKRPVPEELIVSIGERLGVTFPDADIQLERGPLVLGCELQHFLVVRW
jgi:hypothetical protein